MRKTGMVFDIQRMSLHNGDGLRTSVFLKGCPLRCLWCHNPESQRMQAELFFKPDKCIACGQCLAVCDVHSLRGDLHLIDRARCQRCLRCADQCPSGALEGVGQAMDVEEVMDVILRDRVFYLSSGGGATITGGEPMAQADFTIALARRCREEGVHVCVDTSGYGPAEAFRALAPWTDVFLFDIKATDPQRHRRLTGVELAPILENLRLLDALGKTIRLRCPIIPGLNDDEAHLAGIAALAESLSQPHAIDVIPYHPLGEQKLRWLDAPHPMEAQSFPEKSTVDGWIAFIAGRTGCLVQRI